MMIIQMNGARLAYIHFYADRAVYVMVSVFIENVAKRFLWMHVQNGAIIYVKRKKIIQCKCHVSFRHVQNFRTKFSHHFF